MVIAILLAFSCGSERTAVKDLLDGVRLPPAAAMTVEQLRALPAPKWSTRAKRRQLERIVAVLDVEVLAYKSEADGDLHAIIRGSTQGSLMIAEMPAPRCVASSRYARAMGTARATFLRLVHAHARRMRLTGVVFFDRPHATGAAPSGVELHPLLKVEALSQ